MGLSLVASNYRHRVLERDHFLWVGEVCWFDGFLQGGRKCFFGLGSTHLYVLDDGRPVFNRNSSSFNLPSFNANEF